MYVIWYHRGMLDSLSGIVVPQTDVTRALAPREVIGVDNWSSYGQLLLHLIVIVASRETMANHVTFSAKSEFLSLATRITKLSVVSYDLYYSVQRMCMHARPFCKLYFSSCTVVFESQAKTGFHPPPFFSPFARSTPVEPALSMSQGQNTCSIIVLQQVFEQRIRRGNVDTFFFSYPTLY